MTGLVWLEPVTRTLWASAGSSVPTVRCWLCG